MKAFFPGTFDPLTNGHLDIVERASSIFDEVVVGVYRGSEKDPLFLPQERLQMVSETVERIPNVTAVTYDGVDGRVREKHRRPGCGARIARPYRFRV